MDDKPGSSRPRPAATVTELEATRYMIGGVSVDFPMKAYPSQLAVMNKVIQGLKHKQHCLLESPTGSGKSLSLLCASLAWQRYESSRAVQHNTAVDARLTRLVSVLEKQRRPKQWQKDRADDGGRLDIEAEGIGFDATASATDEHTDGVVGDQVDGDLMDVDGDDDFEPAAAKRGLNDDSIGNMEHIVSTEKIGVPRIFFGTRTHKQVSQLIRELRKTSYVESRCVILSGRDRTCINPDVEVLPNKNEACKELLDNPNNMDVGCRFYPSAKKLGSFTTLPSYGVRPGYDLEDLVTAGRTASSCPYFASRNLMQTADIVFCPYNYLVDPAIKTSLAIDLEGQVIIFDEGHNIEEASREASSFTIDQDEIKAALQDCERVAHCDGVHSKAHFSLATLFSIFSGWINKNQNQSGFVDSTGWDGTCLTGTELMTSMEMATLNEAKLRELEYCHKVIVAQRERDVELAKNIAQNATERPPYVSQSTLRLLEIIFRMFRQLSLQGGVHRDDFRLALFKKTIRGKAKHVTCLSFWCLNPAITFEEIQRVAHCVVITSGTLSPLQSFDSELGTLFPIRLEAPHVIHAKQVLVATVQMGPNNINLNGSFANTGTTSYQDEVGYLVRDVCREIQRGVLCFFSSYKMLGSMEDRWKATGMWDDISNIKVIFTEPRTGAYSLDKAMTSFYDSVAHPKASRTGALFLAVYRGKVSEGLDFADDNGRAVICVGIPFQNYRDLKIQHKRDYNDRNQHRGLLSGGEWYDIQAFRALNQSIGRCIRHKCDWGAILLVDDRYSKSTRYVNLLPKWVRNSIHHFHDWNSCVSSLALFREQMGRDQ